MSELQVQGIPFKGFTNLGKRGVSIYEENNVCTNCKLRYPKNVYRCNNKNPKCTRALKSRSYTVSARQRLQSEVKRIG